MSMYQLAQLNIGRIRAPLDTPTMAGFVARLEDINALADAAPGFVWRLKTEDGDATAIRPYDDDRMLVNLSVWTSLAGHRPSVDEAKERLDHLRQNGETAYAFTYRHPFAVPGASTPLSPDEYRDECPAT